MRPRPTPLEEVNCIGSGVSKVTTPLVGGANGTTMVVMWRDSCVRVDGTFRTIPTVGILRGGSFSSPPEPLYWLSCLRYFFKCALNDYYSASSYLLNRHLKFFSLSFLFLFFYINTAPISITPTAARATENKTTM